MSKKKELQEKIEELENLEMELLERSSCFREIEPIREYINELYSELDNYENEKEEILTSNPEYISEKVITTLRAKDLSDEEIEEYLRTKVRSIIQEEESLSKKGICSGKEEKLPIFYSQSKDTEELSVYEDDLQKLIRKATNYIIASGGS